MIVVDAPDFPEPDELAAIAGRLGVRPEDLLALMDGQAASAVRPRNPSGTLGQILRACLDDRSLMQRGHYAATTLATYRHVVRQLRAHLERAGVDLDARDVRTDIDPEVIASFVATIRGAPNAAQATRRQRVVVAGKVVTVAMRQGLLTQDPLRTIAFPRDRRRRRRRALDPEELADFLQLCRRTRYPVRDHMLGRCLAYLGLRLHELLGVTLADLDWHSEGGALPRISVLGKGAKVRHVPVSDALRAHLETYLRDYHRVDPATLPPRDGELAKRPLIFCWRGGARCRLPQRTAQDTLARIFQRLRDAHPRLRDWQLSAHALRYTYATALLRAGISTVVIASLLGHDSIRTTEIYLSVQWHDLVTAVQRGLPSPKEALANDH